MRIGMTFLLSCASSVRNRPYAAWIALAAIIFVGLWRECITLTKPAHFNQKAIELGSVSPFRQALYANSSGNRVSFVRHTENGIGVFLWSGSGKAKLLYEHDDSKLGWTQFGLLGWSTDGSLFAYACQMSRKSAQIIVVNGDSGATVQKIPSGGTITGFTWLSPTKFTYMTDKREVWVFEENEGKWVQAALFKNVADVPPNLSDHLAAGRTRVLYALSDHEIAWLEKGSIWSFNMASKSTQALWTTNKGVIDASFCFRTKEFLLEIGDLNSQSLYKYSYTTGSMIDLGRAGDKDRPLSFPGWVDNGNEYTYLVKENANYTLFLAGKGTNESRQLFSKDGVLRYTCEGKSLFICGSMMNEPPGIWEYDLVDNEARCIVPASQKPFRYATSVLPQWDSLTNNNGNKFNYCIWTPVGGAKNKRYPVILCQTPYNWTPYAEMAANEGYYFVSIDRAKWIDKGLDEWALDVECAYDHLAATLNIDKNSVFFMGASAETAPISAFVSAHPHFCKGVLLYHPAALPNLSSAGISTMLIVDGSQTPGEVKRVAQYQSEALKLGVPVTVKFLNTPHSSWRISVQRQNIQVLARYLAGLQN